MQKLNKSTGLTAKEARNFFSFLNPDSIEWANCILCTPSSEVNIFSKHSLKHKDANSSGLLSHLRRSHPDVCRSTDVSITESQIEPQQSIPNLFQCINSTLNILTNKKPKMYIHLFYVSSRTIFLIKY